MATLWIFETHKQEYLDDCKSFQVYGADDPHLLGVCGVSEGDSVLIRLKFWNKNKNEYGYLGPFIASSNSQRTWVSSVVAHDGIWSKIEADPANSPRWLRRFPWCLFLDPAPKYIAELRILQSTENIQACRPITGNRIEETLASLIQDEFLPESKIKGYRTKRGVWVRSRAEHMIDDWFTDRGIVTYYEKSIYLDSIRITPDWYIPRIDTYVEFLGLRGDPSYDSMCAQKERTYKDNSIRFVTLVDQDLGDLDRSIPQKLPELRKMGIR